jgi:hypothetical protein
MTSGTIDAALDEGIRDFTKERRKIRFKIDGDVFYCVPDLPILVLIDFASMADKLDETAMDDKMRSLFVNMFNLVLVDESAERFIARMGDKSNPISMEQINEIMPWVMERYGLRPTEPSGSSSAGSPTLASGPSSTVNVPAAALTSDSFPSTDS